MARTTTQGVAPGSALKRILLGRAFSSDRLEHTLLPKVLALPVFASDALSSVAYATGEILIALTLVTASPHRYLLPIAIAVASLMAIVVSSYRQTVRAYPRGGGAYRVSKENLGTLAGLIAAGALLFDYMMTVIVSVVFGVFAIGSALPWALDHRVLLSVFFVALVTVLNLRGSKESGTLFAIPTYGFIVSILALVVFGIARCLGGCPSVGVEVEVLHEAAATSGAIGVFAILRAFSQGATALTGVEAISDGVLAFRKPQAQNAAATLAIMGTIGVTMFLGISWLATSIDGVVASEDRSVVAQIAIGVFGPGSLGFYVVQSFTAAILILAANTAYQDFPRLSSILARDRFMPSQFVNRGDRLVFSNGVIGLSVLSCLMIWAYDADGDRLIHLYVVGVFTSFTLSQTGMIRHWLAEGRKAATATSVWRRSIAINAIGAATTGVVLVVVIISKFPDGAWLSILIMLSLVPVFYAIHRHYESVGRQLRLGRVHPGELQRTHVVLLVRDLGPATAEALGYARSLRPEGLRVVAPATAPADLADGWSVFGGGLELERLPRGGLLETVSAYVRALPRGDDEVVTVIVPEVIQAGLLAYLLRNRALIRLKAGLLRVPGVVVTDVPVAVEDGGRPIGVDARPFIPNRVVALVFVSSVNDAAIRAVNYARALEASETRAVYFDLDPDVAHDLERSWFDSGLDVPLDIIEAPFRDLTPPVLSEIRRFTARPDTVVTVVMPELLVTRWWHLLLHNQSALFIKRLLLFEERAVLSSVPFRLASRRKELASPASQAAQ